MLILSTNAQCLKSYVAYVYTLRKIHYDIGCLNLEGTIKNKFMQNVTISKRRDKIVKAVSAHR